MEAKPKLYLETSIPSYLTARPSRDVIILARQELTRDWWDNQRDNFSIFISQFVLDEVSQGDPDYARLRLGVIASLPMLAITPEIRELAEHLFPILNLPARASVDVAHLATAIHHEMDFLLTWNCAHLANAHVRRSLERFAINCGRDIPTLCTPGDLIKRGVE